MMLRDGAIPKLASLAFRKKKKKQNEIGISLYYKKQKKKKDSDQSSNTTTSSKKHTLINHSQLLKFKTFSVLHTQTKDVQNLSEDQIEIQVSLTQTSI